MTSVPVVDERLHYATIKALLDPAVGNDPISSSSRVFRFGEAPGDERNPDETLRTATPPPIYLLVSIERRTGGPRRSGRTGISGWRASVRAVGTDPDEAAWALAKATAALDEARLVFGPLKSTPLAFDSNTAVEPDDSRFSGLITWTYST